MLCCNLILRINISFQLLLMGSILQARLIRVIFTGFVGFEHYKMVWKSWAPPECRFFLWLVAHNRCWTVDRLEKKGLNHPPRCPLCDQESETINHLLVSCSFSRLYWYITFRKFGLHILAPLQDDTNFLQWWKRIANIVSDMTKKGVNSLLIMGAWMIWKFRNRVVFDAPQYHYNLRGHCWGKGETYGCRS